MTREQFIAKWPNASASTLRANGFAPLGAVESAKHTEPAPALDRNAAPEPKSKRGVAVCVSIIGIRRRLLDSDNFIAGAKPLRDQIARSLAIDDGSDRIRFDYGQVVSAGEEGTIVRIEWL